MPLVTFREDIFPYCKDDVVNLTKEEKARVDAEAKGRHLDTAYVAGDKQERTTVKDSRELTDTRLADARGEARQNAVDQAAQLEAQRNSVAVPANVEALGLKQEEPQVVTGTEPVDGVEVVNPQQAVDIGDPKGAEVKGSKTKK